MGIFAGCQNQSFYRKMALNVQGVFQNACPEELEVLNINSLVLDSLFFLLSLSGFSFRLKYIIFLPLFMSFTLCCVNCLTKLFSFTCRDSCFFVTLDSDN